MMRAEDTAVAKPRVTRRVHVKKPWYERPWLLFIALIIALGIGGILISRLMSGGKGVSTLGGPVTTDATTEAPAAPAPAAPAPTPGDDLTGILSASDPLPAAEPGMVLPPIRVETTAEATEARRVLRLARAVTSGAAPAFIEGASLVEASAGGAAPPWDALSLRNEQRAFCDFEVSRAADGSAYLIGFVSVEVARALAALGPTFTYPAAGQEPPGWQVWKKRGDGDRLVLRGGSEVTLFPDLSPEATCLVAFPLQHLQPLRVRRVQTGRTQPAEALEATLR
jgi:hypothetical protein